MIDSLIVSRIRKASILVAIVALVAGCAGSTARQSASARGINQRFLDPELDVGKLVDTFESESREIYTGRDAIVERLDLTPGMSVADIGAGTGLFLEPFSSGVGSAGKVYAVDISPRLVEFMARRARDERLSPVETVLCTERSAELPAESVDLVFMSDTYHHFEYPASTLASLHSALRPGGRMFVVDFERIPGESRPWILDHVRTGKNEVVAEIERSGFVFESEIDVPGLEENYMLRFRRP